jgi:hypothetical protein
MCLIFYEFETSGVIGLSWNWFTNNTTFFTHVAQQTSRYSMGGQGPICLRMRRYVNGPTDVVISEISRDLTNYRSCTDQQSIASYFGTDIPNQVGICVSCRNISTGAFVRHFKSGSL